ncbi:hypothetical protein BACSP_03908 [Bacillus sp. T2.9-1]|nr:hypothetical protein BACSP_03908 [Bacillus sp. T2.9-1]
MFLGTVPKSGLKVSYLPMKIFKQEDMTPFFVLQ